MNCEIINMNTSERKTPLKKQFIRGFIRATPVMMGYFPVGFAFGVLAANAGISPLSAMAMSVLIYAGSGQLMAVSLIESGVTIFTLTFTVFLINLRHLLMSTYIAPFLSHLKRWQQALFTFEMTDEAFAVHSSAMNHTEKAYPAEILFLNFCNHSSWIISGFLGALVGSRLSVNTDIFGLDFALPGMFIFLLVMQIRNNRLLVIALLAAFLSTVFLLSGAGHWYIILATIAAATAGMLTENINSYRM